MFKIIYMQYIRQKYVQSCTSEYDIFDFNWRVWQEYKKMRDNIDVCVTLEVDHQVIICLTNQAFSFLSILCLWTKDTMKSTAYISPRMIHIAPMASPASRFLGEMW